MFISIGLSNKSISSILHVILWILLLSTGMNLQWYSSRTNSSITVNSPFISENIDNEGTASRTQHVSDCQISFFEICNCSAHDLSFFEMWKLACWTKQADLLGCLKKKDLSSKHEVFFGFRYHFIFAEINCILISYTSGFFPVEQGMLCYSAEIEVQIRIDQTSR